MRGKGRTPHRTQNKAVKSLVCEVLLQNLIVCFCLFEVIDKNVVRQRLIAVLGQSGLVMIKVSTFQLMVTGVYVI